jgi:hypothetical protein
MPGAMPVKAGPWQRTQAGMPRSGAPFNARDCLRASISLGIGETDAGRAGTVWAAKNSAISRK